MSPTSDEDTFRLSVPASADRLSTMRLFAAAVARQEGAHEDAVEDLRLAVSEAGTIGLQAARSPATLLVTMGLIPSPRGVAVEVRTIAGPREGPGGDVPSGDGGSGDGDGVDPAEGWGADMLEAIVSGLELRSLDHGQVSVSFVATLEPVLGAGPDEAGGS